jgi:hypothetical protein
MGAGKSENHALVAYHQSFDVFFAPAGLLRPSVTARLHYVGHYRAGAGIEIIVVIAGFPYNLPGDILDVDYCGGVEPDRNKEDARSHRALGIDHGHRILSQKLPYEGVTYLIA